MGANECYAYFEIRSAGHMEVEAGYIAEPDSDFDPDYITKKLGIQPHRTMRMSAARENGIGEYPCSSWVFQPEPEEDDPTQCMSIVNALKDKTPLLREIYKELNVSFAIQVHAYMGVNDFGAIPCFGFDHEIIDFCYETYTEIGLLFQVYPKE